MTPPEVDEQLRAQIEAVLSRRRRDLTLDELEQLEQTLTVPCNGSDDRPAGCGAAAGEECRHLHDGHPLVHLLAHWCRLKRAGARYGPPTQRHELAGFPKRRFRQVPAQRDWSEPRTRWD